MTQTTNNRNSRANLEARLTTLLVLDWEKTAYIALFVLAVLSRFWDLGARVMSHDESLHTRFSWDLYRGAGYRHTPLMHGPLLFHMTALSYFLFGDNDFTARIYPAALGVLIVMFPALMRRWLGKLGALAASLMFLISPLMLYYSRYIRHDIPAIFFALVIAYGIWRYVEKPAFKWLAWIGAASALMYASKEVAFFYTAIFSSFLFIYFVVDLFKNNRWTESRGVGVFIGLLAALIVVSTLVGSMSVLAARGNTLLFGDDTATAEGGETVEPPDPLGTQDESAETATPISGLTQTLIIVGLALAGTLLVATSIIAINGIKDSPALDLLIIVGTLVLPLLTPFAIHAAGFDATDDTLEGIRTSAIFAGAGVLISLIIGMAWGWRQKKDTAPIAHDPLEQVVAVIANNWLVIAGIYYALFFFFFTSVFTNGKGVGTGIVGSLGYWLDQQEVRRGSQPPYYYMLVMVPLYEFLPLLLTLAVFISTPVRGLINLIKTSRQMLDENDEDEQAEENEAASAPSPFAQEPAPDPTAPPGETRFPVLLFIAYWIVLNFVGYSLAGEKMPWLTTHLTTPMILLAGWAVGRLLNNIEWAVMRDRYGWLVLALIPVWVIAFARVITPLLAGQSPFGGQTQEELAATSAWITALLIWLGATGGLATISGRLGSATTFRLTGLVVVGVLAFQTTRAAWLSTYINYDYATEYLVYAHSAPAVKVVMQQIEEISIKTTDSLNLKVAYDNRVSWPFSWYLRDYPQAIYYGDQPTRSQLSDAPVILAGPDNWAKVEPITGDRYYHFEYIRMWWPMQDYFDLTPERAFEALNDPQIRAGIWQIYLNRSFDTYGQATDKDFSTQNWPVAERMRFYVRKDVFAQVWDYGVVASELAEAVDPYAEGRLDAQPILTIGQQGIGAGQLNSPRDIAISPDGLLLYVADSMNHRVQIFTLDGEFVRSIGGGVLSPDEGSFNEPWGLALDQDGNLYVADTWNHRVQKFDSQGNFIAAWGFFGQTESEPGALWGPRDVSVSPQGEVFVSDTGNKRIQVYDTDGNYLRQIGRGGSLGGQLDEPVGLSYGSDSRLYVADTWNQRVQAFSPSGAFLQEWQVSAWYGQSLDNKPYLYVADTGHVYVADPEGFRILVFDSRGQYVTSLGDFESINLASSIALDSDGNLYVADAAAGKVLVFAPVIDPPLP